MKYYLDTEFNGFGGEVISLALIPDQPGPSLYLARQCSRPSAWVKANVLPNLKRDPIPRFEEGPWAQDIQEFLGNDPAEIIADWPEDLANFLRELIEAPGTCVTINVSMTLKNKSSLPDVKTAHSIEHHAWWDAMRLRAQCHRMEQIV